MLPHMAEIQVEKLDCDKIRLFLELIIILLYDQE